jgi:hypothetical protein
MGKTWKYFLQSQEWYMGVFSLHSYSHSGKSAIAKLSKLAGDTMSVSEQWPTASISRAYILLHTTFFTYRKYIGKSAVHSVTMIFGGKKRKEKRGKCFLSKQVHKYPKAPYLSSPPQENWYEEEKNRRACE